MRVIEKFKDATGPDWDNAGPWELEITSDDGTSKKLCVYESEPEDNSFGRDLSFVFQITNLLRQAYEAGKAGEEYHCEYIEKKEEDE